jgi:hypothetical protein
VAGSTQMAPPRMAVVVAVVAVTCSRLSARMTYQLPSLSRWAKAALGAAPPRFQAPLAATRCSAPLQRPTVAVAAAVEVVGTSDMVAGVGARLLLVARGRQTGHRLGRG